MTSATLSHRTLASVPAARTLSGAEVPVIKKVKFKYQGFDSVTGLWQQFDFDYAQSPDFDYAQPPCSGEGH